MERDVEADRSILAEPEDGSCLGGARGGGAAPICWSAAGSSSSSRRRNGDSGDGRGCLMTGEGFWLVGGEIPRELLEDASVGVG